MEFLADEEASHLLPKQRKQDSSSVKIPSLPPELITEILLRVPIKSLFKFRSVSKSWLALISSPEFKKTHLKFSANNKDYIHHRLIMGTNLQNRFKDCSLITLLYGSDTEDFEVFDLDFPMTSYFNHVVLVGCVNGLVCLATELKDVFIWNPSIRKFKKLPDFMYELTSDACVMYGFGYDEVHDDYKVVVGFQKTEHLCADISMYSLNRGSCGSIGEPGSELPLCKSGKVVNGKLHWANRLHIVSVDLADGGNGKLERPCCRKGAAAGFGLEVLGSDLSAFCRYEGRLTTVIDVWIMKEYGVNESWMKMFTINCLGVELWRSLQPLFCVFDKSEIFFKRGEVYMMYNLKDGSIRYSKVINRCSIAEACIYTRSLVWPFSIEEPES